MSSTGVNNGKLCNQIIRNLSLSILAKKYDLYVTYSNYDKINNQLGIELYVGNNKYKKTKVIKNNDFIKYFEKNIKDNVNFNFMKDYFQSEKITTILHNHLIENMKNIIDKNPYKDRYKNNNDVFLHVRLLVPKKLYLEADYYIRCINLLEYDNIYIGSDDFNHTVIEKIKSAYPKVIFIEKDPVETIQFGSTCKNIILSHGSFSAIIGYLGFFSNVYFMNKKNGWCPIDMLINKGFISVDL